MMQKANSIANVNGKAGNKIDQRDHARVYLVKTRQLRISSTKDWAKTLHQLKQQIKSGGLMTGGLQDHFC
jgi:hypothetical protein